MLIVEDVITTGKSSIECSKLVDSSKSKIAGYACIIDRSNGNSAIKDKIVSQVQLDIPTYNKNNLVKGSSDFRCSKVNIFKGENENYSRSFYKTKNVSIQFMQHNQSTKYPDWQ